MTDNDKDILKRWRNAEISHEILKKLDLETPGWLLSDRTPQEKAVIDEHCEAGQALKNILDPDVQLIVVRYHQSPPDVYFSDPRWQVHVDDWEAGTFGGRRQTRSHVCELNRTKFLKV